MGNAVTESTRIAEVVMYTGHIEELVQTRMARPNSGVPGVANVPGG